MKQLIGIWMAAMLAIVAFIFFGCSAPKVVTVTEYRERVQTDTLRKVDSVYVAHYVWQKGDTVRLTDTICQYRILRDVREVVIRDSVPYPVEIEVQVRYVPDFYKKCTCGFWVLLLLLILAAVGWAIKAFYLRR